MMQLCHLLNLKQSSSRIASINHGHGHGDGDQASRNIVEVNIISVQSLPQTQTKIQTYVIAYIDPNKKLTSRTIDVTAENSIPTWNDKLIFFIDKNLVLKRPNACMVFEIYQARSKNKDKKIGVAQVLVQDLLVKNCGPVKGMAIHVNTGHDKLNKSLFPIFKNHSDDLQPDQAILNIGVDTSFSSFYNSSSSDHSSCMDYRQLMGY